MKVTVEIISAKLDSLADGTLAREEASSFALEAMQANDLRALEFDPSEMEAKLWESIVFLYSYDILIDSAEYLYSLQDLARFRAQIGF